MEGLDAEVRHLACAIVNEGSTRGLTCGTAESCTGGLVCAAITDVPGSSVVLRGGVVSYATEIKNEVLGVSRAITDDPALGVVSGPCAEQMASGARRVLGCDLAVSVTGIAGPGGAEPGKPVGTVWFGLATPEGERSWERRFAGERTSVRAQATVEALKALAAAIVEI